MIILIVVAVVGSLLLVAYVIDRQDRKHGHSPRASADMSRSARDARQDARVIDFNPASTNDAGWTEFHRRGRARTRRR